MQKAGKFIWILKIIALYFALFIYRELFIRILYLVDIRLNDMLITGIYNALKVALSVIIMKLIVHKKEKLHFDRVTKYLYQLMMGIIIGFLSFIVIFGIFIVTGVATIDHFNNISLKGLGLAVGIYMFVGVTEEIFSRGVVGNILKESNNKYVVYILSSALFVWMHIRNEGIDIIPMINLFIAGIILIDMYMKSGNLCMCIGFHFSWNFIQSCLGFSVSGTGNVNSIFTLSFTGSKQITGGSFGAEGSIITSIILILTIFFMSKVNIPSKSANRAINT
jgi:membrane protease YdiL (CAAX protease family)